MDKQLFSDGDQAEIIRGGITTYRGRVSPWNDFGRAFSTSTFGNGKFIALILGMKGSSSALEFGRVTVSKITYLFAFRFCFSVMSQDEGKDTDHMCRLVIYVTYFLRSFLYFVGLFVFSRTRNNFLSRRSRAE